MPKNGWEEYKRLVLSEMEANKQFRIEVREVLGDLREVLGGLKVKTAVAGGVAGIVGTAIMTFLVSLWN